MKEQRRMILMEQLKSIKRELGLEKDDKAALISRWVLWGCAASLKV
jgi:Lon-like ATP-dependent protease